MTKRSPFRYFKTSAEIIRLAVIMYVRFPLSLRNVEDLLHERGVEISHEMVRFPGWKQRQVPMPETKYSAPPGVSVARSGDHGVAITDEVSLRQRCAALSCSVSG